MECPLILLRYKLYIIDDHSCLDLYQTFTDCVTHFSILTCQRVLHIMEGYLIQLRKFFIYYNMFETFFQIVC